DDRDHLFHAILFSGGFAAGDGRWTRPPPPLVYFCHHPATVGDRVRGPGPATPTGRARVVSRDQQAADYHATRRAAISSLARTPTAVCTRAASSRCPHSSSSAI